MKKIVGTIILMLLAIGLFGCKTWHWGDIIIYEIPKGEHADVGMPSIIEGTEKWGGEMILEYNPDEMVDEEYNFAYWNKLGGMMPDINDNFTEGKHQSARIAWRVDPDDPSYFYVGYIVYVYGETEPHRDYLKDSNDQRIRIPVGVEFYPQVIKYDAWWGVYVEYQGTGGYIKIEDDKLKREKFMVVMDPYYGGEPVAPTDIYITLKYIDTTWLY